MAKLYGGLKSPKMSSLRAVGTVPAATGGAGGGSWVDGRLASVDPDPYFDDVAFLIQPHYGDDMETATSDRGPAGRHFEPTNSATGLQTTTYNNSTSSNFQMNLSDGTGDSLATDDNAKTSGWVGGDMKYYDGLWPLGAALTSAQYGSYVMKSVGSAFPDLAQDWTFELNGYLCPWRSQLMRTYRKPGGWSRLFDTIGQTFDYYVGKGFADQGANYFYTPGGSVYTFNSTSGQSNQDNNRSDAFYGMGGPSFSLCLQYDHSDTLVRQWVNGYRGYYASADGSADFTGWNSNSVTAFGLCGYANGTTHNGYIGGGLLGARLTLGRHRYPINYGVHNSGYMYIPPLFFPER